MRLDRGTIVPLASRTMIKEAAQAFFHRYRLLPPAYLHHLAGDFARTLDALGLGDGWRERVVAAGSLQPEERVLEVGAGMAALAMSIKREHPAVHLEIVEPRAGALDAARGKAAAWGAEITTHASALTTLPLPDASFDVAFCALQLSRLVADEPDVVLRELYRVVRPGGRIVIADLAVGTYAHYLPRELERVVSPLASPLGGRMGARLADAGFEDVRTAFRWRGLLATWVARRA